MKYDGVARIANRDMVRFQLKIGYKLVCVFELCGTITY